MLPVRVHIHKRSRPSWGGLALATLVVALLGCRASRPDRPVPIRRPNVLVIMADDHATEVFGAYGNPKARTPHLDALSAAGVRFQRAYAPQPICTPSRQAILTGLHAPGAGVTLLGTALREDRLTMADHFAAHGYRTAAIGKMHFQSKLDHGFQLRVDKQDHAAALARKPRRPAPAGVRVRPRWKPFSDPARIWLNADALPEGRYEEDSEARFFAQTAIDFLGERQGPEARPFFLWLSFYEPHSPFNFPIDWAGRFHPEDMTAPPVPPGDVPDVPRVFRDLTETDKRGVAAAYYTSTAFMDAQVGRVLAALRERGLDRDTVVVYLSDHGYHLGHHGRFEKHSFFERAVRAPLVVRGPGLPAGRTISGLVELTDVFPTVCALTGVPAPAGLHGESLVPLLTGARATGRSFVVSTYGHDEQAMIRTDEWKLIRGAGRLERDDGYATGSPPAGRWRRLYDVRNDPEETKDLSGDPAQTGVIALLERRLHARLREIWPADKPIPANLAFDEALDFLLRPVERIP